MCIADIISLAGSKTSARSVSPGGSIIALSDRLSLASGSIPGIIQETALSPQQLGAMGRLMIIIFSNLTRSKLAQCH